MERRHVSLRKEGVQVTEEGRGWDDHVIEYLAVGTAIVKLEGEVPQLPVVLPLSDGGRG
jgi:hypothetical protein